MRNTGKVVPTRVSLLIGLGISLAAALYVLPPALAQDPGVPSCSSSVPNICQGDKAVYNQSSVTNSHAYIDASALSGADICAKITSALMSLTSNSQVYTSGVGVIDARGFKPGTTQSCAISPWNGTSGTTNTPATILLPSGTITISSTWVLPSKTKIFGEGVGGSGQGTTVQWTPTTGGLMMQMGVSSGCTGVSIENLTLDGNKVAGVNGIANSNCGDLSYVDHVWLYRILGIGLQVSPGAERSGPYSNMTFNAADGSASAVTNTECVSLSANYTHGVHQMNCTINGNQETAIAQKAIDLSGSNNSIEDVRIEGFENGIVIEANTSSNVLKNIDGDSDTTSAAPTVNVIDVSNCSGVHDLVIIGVGNTGNISTSHTQTNTTIADGCTGINLQDGYVAMYVLGRSSSGGYSRFTTSPYAANWTVGAGSPPSGACVPTDSATNKPGEPGSLYSNTNGASPALWVCPNAANAVWTAPMNQ